MPTVITCCTVVACNQTEVGMSMLDELVYREQGDLWCCVCFQPLTIITFLTVTTCTCLPKQQPDDFSMSVYLKERYRQLFDTFGEVCLDDTATQAIVPHQPPSAVLAQVKVLHSNQQLLRPVLLYFALQPPVGVPHDGKCKT